jgi:hypothetical protein
MGAVGTLWYIGLLYFGLLYCQNMAAMLSNEMPLKEAIPTKIW